MELTANEREAYLVGGQLETEEKGKERYIYIKYEDRYISCTHILDITGQGYNAGQNKGGGEKKRKRRRRDKHTLTIDKTL